MTFAVAVVLLLVVLSRVALLFHARWSRGKVFAKLRSTWGAITPPTTLDDDRVAEAWRELESAEPDPAAVDDRTWADLDLDSVHATLDRTHTALGRQRLYWRLRSGVAWSASPCMEALAARFGSEPTLRESVGVTLAGAGRSLGNGLWLITRPHLIRVRWWYWGFPLLALLMFGSIAAIAFEPRALIVCFAVLVINMAVRMATAWQIPELLAPMRQMGPLIRTAERLVPLADSASDTPDAVVDDVKRLRPLRRIASWVSRDPIASGELLASVWEYLNLMFVLDANALLFGAKHLERLAPVLARVAAWVGDVDVALSVASLRAEPRPWCTPTWSEASCTRGEGIWHPLVTDPVVNDVTICAGRGTVITGANMSGKSTYLRTVGIAAVLARAVNSCPATSWSGRAFRVRSLIGRTDDLSAGKSYYQVEADGVVELLHESRQALPTLFLLDELLRGTNTIERLAAGEAVLRAFLEQRGAGNPHAVIVATHDGELVTMLKDLYTPIHFQETIGPSGLSFDYRWREGPATTRTAIALLEATGAPCGVIAAARARAEELDGGSSSNALAPPRS